MAKELGATRPDKNLWMNVVALHNGAYLGNTFRSTSRARPSATLGRILDRDHVVYLAGILENPAAEILGRNNK